MKVSTGSDLRAWPSLTIEPGPAEHERRKIPIGPFAPGDRRASPRRTSTARGPRRRRPPHPRRGAARRTRRLSNNFRTVSPRDLNIARTMHPVRGRCGRSPRGRRCINIPVGSSHVGPRPRRPGGQLRESLVDNRAPTRRSGVGWARSALPSKPRRTGRSGALAALVPVVSLGAGDHAVCAASPAFCPWLATCTDRFCGYERGLPGTIMAVVSC